MGWLIIIGGLLAFGFLVDWLYKRKGIAYTDPKENEKHVSKSERVYMESHMHNMKDNNKF
ncbi:hypothetical protein JK635_23195 [Neobacillus sp. YIM B02564]|uniref:Uncharacterized protein n=1 Tax=Neobacillus paridis TaxID=2803862 RepID=A0ABS1TV48_9BACI|nr:hypothetical protein [Neobacillus paridis]MBL4955068.1 hypothetical protein [Neobacillus paridis]